MSTLPTLIIWLYRSMTAAKAVQWMLHWYGSRNANNNSKDRIAYRPSLQAALTLINLMASTAEQEWKSVENVPRKEYQKITDPMLQRYLHTYVKGKAPKTFHSLQDAQATFFAEFTGTSNRTTWFLSKSIKLYAVLQMAAPMGLTWCLYVIPWFVLSAVALVHDRGNLHNWVLHVAIAVTITDVYVVCCKDQLTLEEGLKKHRWLDIFTRPQHHPLIGTRVCPLYKRPIEFRPDVMEFEFDVVEHSSAMPTLHEKKDYNTQWWWWCSAVLLVAIGVALSMLPQAQLEVIYQAILSVLPTALLFYAVRLVVDTTMGAAWDNWWAL